MKAQTAESHPSSAFLSLWVSGGDSEFLILTCCQVMQMLLVQGLHSEERCCKALRCTHLPLHSGLKDLFSLQELPPCPRSQPFPLGSPTSNDCLMLRIRRGPQPHDNGSEGRSKFRASSKISLQLSFSLRVVLPPSLSSLASIPEHFPIYSLGVNPSQTLPPREPSVLHAQKNC